LLPIYYPSFTKYLYIYIKYGTEFGFVKILSKTDKEAIFHLNLDLLTTEDEKK